jgi:hypothetical protein
VDDGYLDRQSQGTAARRRDCTLTAIARLPLWSHQPRNTHKDGADRLISAQTPSFDRLGFEFESLQGHFLKVLIRGLFRIELPEFVGHFDCN